MDKILPITRVKKYATRQTVRLSERTLKEQKRTGKFLIEIGNISLFISRIFKETFSLEFEFREFFRQCYLMGNKSFPLVAITGIIMGLVLTIQSRPVMVDFGAEGFIPGMVAISLIREIAPVITGLICAGKIGSGIGAELGSMKVTEQIDAMEVSAANPIKFLVVTRMLAATFMLPLLVLFADAMGLIGSWIGMNLKSEVSFIIFLSKAFSSIEFIDFFPATIKTFFFGAVIGIVGCYKGFIAGKGTESVGAAANSAVVISSLMIFIVDMIAVQITDMMYE